MNLYVAIAIILIIISLVALPIIRRLTVSSVEEALIRQDFKTFDKKIGRWYIRLFMSPFNADYLKLNRALMSGDKEKTDEAFERFDNVNLNEQQKEEVYLRGFEYYLSLEDQGDQEDPEDPENQKNQEKIDKYYELIKELDNEDIVTYTEHLYDIYVLKGWTYLDEILEESERDDLTRDRQMEAYSLIAAMYQNMGEDAKAQEYLDKIEAKL